MNFDDVIKDIRQQMEDGDSNWQMPWHGKQVVPLNVSKAVPYSGINRLILWAQYRKHNWKDNYWGTLRQWQARGELVAKGSKGTALVMPIIKSGAIAEEELAGFRRFTVFNGDQVRNRNISHPDMFGYEAAKEPNVEAFVDATGAHIEHGFEGACYIGGLDKIEMPWREAFVNTATSTATQNYYSTLLHELVHWTKHPSRENRFVQLDDRKRSYAFEELVAELGAAFLCADFGLEDVPRKDHAQYLNSWLALIEDQATWFWRASSLAQKAIQHLFNVQTEEPEYDDSVPDWFAPEPVQIDMLAPKVLGTGH